MDKENLKNTEDKCLFCDYYMKYGMPCMFFPCAQIKGVDR